MFSTRPPPLESENLRKRRSTPSSPQELDGWPGSKSSSRPSQTLTPDHRTLTSSTEASMYDDDVPEETATNFVREYGFYYTAWNRHVVVCANDSRKTPVYFAEISNFTRHKPAITLHAIDPQSLTANTPTGRLFPVDEGKASPTVAVAFFDFPSRHVKLGLGDPNTAPVIWEEMRNQKKLTHSEYRFELSTNDHHVSAFSNDIPNHTRHGYTWKRTRSATDGVGTSLSARWSYDNFKMTLDGGSTLAVYLENGAKSFRKKGKIRLYADERGAEMLREAEAATILSCVSIFEKTRRRRKQRSFHRGGA